MVHFYLTTSVIVKVKITRKIIVKMSLDQYSIENDMPQESSGAMDPINSIGVTKVATTPLISEVMEVNLMRLIKFICEYEKQNIDLRVNEKDSLGNTALYYAVTSNHWSFEISAVSTLLDIGADLDITQSDGMTCREYISKYKSHLVKQLK